MRVKVTIRTTVLIAATVFASHASGQSMEADHPCEPALPKLPGGIRPASPTPRRALLEQTNQVLRSKVTGTAGTNPALRAGGSGIRRVVSRDPVEAYCEGRDRVGAAIHNAARVQSGAREIVLGLSIDVQAMYTTRVVSVSRCGFATDDHRGVFQAPCWFPCHIVYPRVIFFGLRSPIHGVPHFGASLSIPRPSSNPSNVIVTQDEKNEALLAMTRSRFKDAIGILDQLTKSCPTDAKLLRFAAIARMSDRDMAAGARMMARAYAMDISLCGSAMHAEEMGLKAPRWRELVRAAVSEGHASDDAEMWFVAATLMQAEGRTEPALRMLERAEAGGFDRGIVAKMRSSL